MTKAEAEKMLAECRQRIDAIDLELRDLLNRRSEIVIDVLHAKNVLDMPIYEANREELVLNRVTEGNPGPLAKVLGGDQGQPGGLSVGGETTFTFRTAARRARLTAMVHPDFTPDNYVTALIDLSAPGTTMLERFDIGDDEGRKTVLKVGPAGSVTIK